jgi:hypothetical protein
MFVALSRWLDSPPHMPFANLDGMEAKVGFRWVSSEQQNPLPKVAWEWHRGIFCV